MKTKYQVIDTVGTIESTTDFNGRTYYSVAELEAAHLIQDYFDFEPHLYKRVKVIIMIGEE